MNRISGSALVRALNSCLCSSWLASAALAAALVLLGSAVPAPAAAAPPGDWAMFGQNLSNTASTPPGNGVKHVQNLQVKWAFTTAGDVSARAAVVNGVAYFPD